MSRLYHFTSLDAACKIIKSGKMRFSKAWRSNDLIENNRVVFERTISERLLVNRPYLLDVEAEMRKYQQIILLKIRNVMGWSIGDLIYIQCGDYMQIKDMVCVLSLIRIN